MVVANVLWDVTPSSMVEIYWCHTLFYCADGGSTAPQNIKKLLPNYTVS